MRFKWDATPWKVQTLQAKDRTTKSPLADSLAQLIYKKMIDAMPYLRNFKYLLAQKKDTPAFREIFGN